MQKYIRFVQLEHKLLPPYATSPDINFLELHSTEYNPNVARTHTHPYEYTYANPTLMSTSEGLSTDRSGDSEVTVDVSSSMGTSLTTESTNFNDYDLYFLSKMIKLKYTDKYSDHSCILYSTNTAVG
jgi:hypothetical protein